MQCLPQSHDWTRSCLAGVFSLVLWVTQFVTRTRNSLQKISHSGNYVALSIDTTPATILARGLLIKYVHPLHPVSISQASLLSWQNTLVIYFIILTRLNCEASIICLFTNPLFAALLLSLHKCIMKPSTIPALLGSLFFATSAAASPSPVLAPRATSVLTPVTITGNG